MFAELSIYIKSYKKFGMAVRKNRNKDNEN